MNAAQPAWAPRRWSEELVGVLRRLRRLRVAAGASEAVAVVGTPELAVIEHGQARDAFADAVSKFATTERDVFAVALALAAEVDGEASRLISYFDGDTDGRPSLRLADALWVDGGDRGGAGVTGWMTEFAAGVAVSHGLIELEGVGTLPTRTMKIAPDLVQRLVADGWTPPRSDGVSWLCWEPALATLELCAGHRDVLEDWARAQARSPLVIAGPAHSGRTTLARCAAGARDLDLLQCHIGHEGHLGRAIAVAKRESRWRSCALLLSIESTEEPSWRTLYNALADVAAPVIVEVPLAWADRACDTRRGVSLLVNELPGWRRRSQQWSSLTAGAIAGADADSLAARFPFPVGQIDRVVRRAQARSSGELSVDAIEVSCRDASAELMSSLCERLPQPYKRSHLVVSEEIEDELDLAVAWVERQGHVMERWGYERRVSLGRGLTAQFAGPPGTGKTMAAQVLARELRMEIFRVDLSRVVDKYIGETEKNLGRLFDDAANAGAILFFDEADALFGKRSAVKDAHDRHANLEVGYLLQRMEAHEGVTILATNRGADLDSAFARRFHIRISFARPTAAQRLRIWLGMFPDAAERADTMRLPTFADAFDFTGGEIRNAVLCAAYLAASEDAVIANRHLARASLRELRKQGKSPSQRCQRLMQGLPA